VLRLLVHVEDDPTSAGSEALDARGWPELVSRSGGELSVERVPGWGTLVRVDVPYGTVTASRSGADAAPSPLTPREHEVLQLLRQGLTDRDVAATLVVSPRTVEKHVSALLRKTATTGRTAAVMHAVEHGWLPPIG
jgi:DNA-binding CsgD family transcriptional regulator